MRILVTGGAGFIGSALVRHLLADRRHVVINVDALTYAALPGALGDVEHDAHHVFVHADVRDAAAMAAVFETHDPDGVIHLAAESHVDRSIAGPAVFVETNVGGTQVLLEAARRHRDRLPGARADAFRWLQVSTDEVYGSAGPSDVFDESSPYAPNSPYAASKAAADHLVRAWRVTYGLPTLVTHGANTYGPFQYPEKLVPVAIYRALTGGLLPVYGNGGQMRDWLHVDDHAAAIARVFTAGEAGQRYNIATGRVCTNRDLVQRIAAIVDRLAPAHAPVAERIRFVADRAGHDQRYALDTRRIRDTLGWQPRIGLDEGLAATVRWCLDHPEFARLLPPA
ncbi:dTDP-glucose 4,6-dehydratase [Salinisphaera hydrothermalis]|uniref:dTDP-glucose 4,6-dehydratase n=1 Tax=Salinisphaera hydrothermalis (strain C41B8) TaxID=1304275 RepID=A0A084INI3_SALHC|nr:dTDP-glucose 4,6-dehydratase [Salinisphaera hydrothermalis]KEZ78267.1 dTDP-glucose 4,6-dehydratase [Salinisphaera hydrothermalis C41B8]